MTDDFPGMTRAKKPYARVAWLGDVHCPYHDQAAWNAAIEFLDDWKPELVVLGGDFYDFYSISSFDKDPERVERLQDEFNAAQPLIDDVKGLMCDVEFLEGNHEDRLRRHMTKNPGIAKLECLELSNAAKLPAEWGIHKPQTMLTLGSLIFLHGDLKGSCGGLYVASRIMKRLKKSCMFGHFHRMQAFYEPGWDQKPLAGFANGWLGDVKKADYVTCPDWTQGIAVVDYDHGSNLFEARQLLIHRGKLRVDGKTYG